MMGLEFGLPFLMKTWKHFLNFYVIGAFPWVDCHEGIIVIIADRVGAIHSGQALAYGLYLSIQSSKL